MVFMLPFLGFGEGRFFCDIRWAAPIDKICRPFRASSTMGRDRGYVRWPATIVMICRPFRASSTMGRDRGYVRWAAPIDKICRPFRASSMPPLQG
jgi:hypothetical protein